MTVQEGYLFSISQVYFTTETLALGAPMKTPHKIVWPLFVLNFLEMILTISDFNLDLPPPPASKAGGYTCGCCKLPTLCGPG